MKTDILIVGSGCSGLYAVLNLPEELDIMLITKSDFEPDIMRMTRSLSRS